MVSVLISIIVIAIVVGLLIYCIRLLPISPPWNNIAVVGIILVAILLILDRTGFLTGLR